MTERRLSIRDPWGTETIDIFEVLSWPDWKVLQAKSCKGRQAMEERHKLSHCCRQEAAVQGKGKHSLNKLLPAALLVQLHRSSIMQSFLEYSFLMPHTTHVGR